MYLCHKGVGIGVWTGPLKHRILFSVKIESGFIFEIVFSKYISKYPSGTYLMSEEELPQCASLYRIHSSSTKLLPIQCRYVFNNEIHSLTIIIVNNITLKL
jgi:hypothetical protein